MKEKKQTVLTLKFIGIDDFSCPTYEDQYGRFWKDLNLGKSHNRRDFGRGFYCTVLESQAEEWAKRLYLRSHKGGRYVYRYLFH